MIFDDKNSQKEDNTEIKWVFYIEIYYELFKDKKHEFKTQLDLISIRYANLMGDEEEYKRMKHEIRHKELTEIKTYLENVINLSVKKPEKNNVYRLLQFDYQRFSYSELYNELVTVEFSNKTALTDEDMQYYFNLSLLYLPCQLFVAANNILTRKRSVKILEEEHKKHKDFEVDSYPFESNKKYYLVHLESQYAIAAGITIEYKTLNGIDIGPSKPISNMKHGTFHQLTVKMQDDGWFTFSFLNSDLVITETKNNHFFLTTYDNSDDQKFKWQKEEKQIINKKFGNNY